MIDGALMELLTGRSQTRAARPALPLHQSQHGTSAPCTRYKLQHDVQHDAALM